MVIKAVHKTTKEVESFRKENVEGIDLYYILETNTPISKTDFTFWYTPLIEKITSLDEYQVLAARTLPDLTEFYPDIIHYETANKLHMKYGVDTEVGEIQDLYKKSFAYRKVFDKVNLLEEVCDFMWYLAGVYTLEGVILSTFLKDIPYSANLVPIEDYPTIPIMEEVLQIRADYTIGDISNEQFIGAFVSSEEELFRGLANNINKLICRYPDKFNNKDAVERNLDTERKQLEQ
jgi:hypothetical protein